MQHGPSAANGVIRLLLLQAEQAFAARDREAAAEAADRLLRLSDGDVEIGLALVDTAAGCGMPVLAAGLAGALAVLTPDDARVQLALADWAGRRRQAHRAVGRAVTLGSAAAIGPAIRIMKQRQDFEAVLWLARHRVALEPGQPAACQALAVLERGGGALGAALAWLSRTAVLDPENPANRDAIEDRFVWFGDFARAAAAYAARPDRLARYRPVRPTLEPAGASLRDMLADGASLIVNLTPDPRLPHNEREYDETYRLHTVLGQGGGGDCGDADFWAFGDPFGIDAGDGTLFGFGYGSDRRLFVKFSLGGSGGLRAGCVLNPGDFYKNFAYRCVFDHAPLWRLGEPLPFARLRDLMRDGRRFRLFVEEADGSWHAHRVGLIYCHLHEAVATITTTPVAYPALFDTALSRLGPFVEDFAAEAADRMHLNAASRQITSPVSAGAWRYDTLGRCLMRPGGVPPPPDGPKRLILSVGHP